MTTIKIPNDLVLETNSIMTHDFETKEYVPKQKMSLNKNTFSFLKEGTKVVYYLDNNEKISNDKFILLKKGVEFNIIYDIGAYRGEFSDYLNQSILKKKFLSV